MENAGTPGSFLAMKDIAVFVLSIISSENSNVSEVTISSTQKHPEIVKIETQRIFSVGEANA